MLSGEIPVSLSWLMNLTTLDLSGNFLSGSVPPEIGNSIKLRGLYLGNNQLNGVIPESLSKLSGLWKLNLSGNALSGPVPSTFGNLNRLLYLDLSCNAFSGELPLSLSTVVSLLGIYVQENRFSGHIDQFFLNSMALSLLSANFSHNFFNGNLPNSLGNLPSITSLDLHRNIFTGEIPPELGNLKQLEYLDVSGNQLSGQIPEEICSLGNLLSLNLSENRLEGPVPSNGICQNNLKMSLDQNKDLCGAVLGLGSCPTKRVHRRWPFHHFWLVASILIALFTLTIAVMICVWVRRRRSRRVDAEVTDESKAISLTDQTRYFSSNIRLEEPFSINIAMFERPLPKLSWVDILKATDNFSQANKIGNGGFGTVYKGHMSNGKAVAVKKSNLAHGERDFEAEMETIGLMKHENLVPLVGYCSFGDEKALVYDYMANESLDVWLGNRKRNRQVLDWPKRLNIATGAAHGLVFLHHDLIPHVIHRDLKSNNILVDKDFQPKIADFGLARLISDCETHVSTAAAGTVGYIPPEYVYSFGGSTTKGDVYSFGVILLELVTGKKPTGMEYKDSEPANLVGWVNQKIKKGRSVDVLDPTVLNVESKQSMLQTLQIAVLCSSDNPASRPTMLDVRDKIGSFSRPSLPT